MRVNRRHPPLTTPLRQRGVGLVELMIGITIGLIVTAGAAVVATRQIVEHRRLMAEVQMQQDLRVTADLLQQDLRRAGYRGLPSNGVWEPERNGGATPAKEAASSPYSSVTVNDSGNVRDVFYRYANWSAAGVPNKSNVLSSNEQFGIRWNSGNQTLYLQLGLVNGQPNWQPISDPDSVLIQNFTVNIVNQSVSLEDLCDASCADSGTCPTQQVRAVTFRITAVSKTDANVRRTLNVTEKLRADEISGVCPPAPVI